MVELTPPPAKRNRIGKILIVVVLVIAGMAVGGYYVSKAGLDEALVKQTLDAWIERSELKASDEGYALDISYGDLAIKGGLTDGHALISNMKIVSKSQDSKDSITVTTAEIKLEPQSADLQDMQIILPTPIHVFEGKSAHETMAVITETPLIFNIEQIEKDNQPYSHVTHTFPTKLTLKFLAGHDAAGKEEQAQNLTPRYDIIEIGMEQGNAEAMTHQEQSDIGNSSVDIRKLTIVPVGDEIGTVTIKRFQSYWSNVLNEKNLNHIQTRIELEDMAADKAFMPYAPINMNIDAEFEGAMPSTPEEFAKIQSQQNAFKLKQFSLSTHDASLNATADFVASGDDILPVGMANMTIGNVQSWRELLKSNQIINAKDEELINTLFIRISGQTLTQAKDVTVDIQRAREGSFQIGNITFEELLAIVLGGIKTPLSVALPEAPVQKAPVDAVKAK